MNRLFHTLVLLVLFSVSACGDNGQAKKIEANRLEAMRVEVARLDAMREEAERVRLEQEARTKRESQARNYARAAGRQIMDTIGGGQDLIVNHRLKYFDATTRTLEIAMEVSFNGAVFRSNNYQVSGVLTVGEDGRNPKFARMAANQNYMDTENTMTALGVTVAGVLILNEMSKQSRSTQNKNNRSDTATWIIRTLDLCNGIGTETVNAAVSFTENGETYAVGWYVLRGDQCVTVNSISERKKVRVFGLSENRIWSGGTPLCVDMNKAFKLLQSDDSCRNGSTARNFFSMTLNQPGDGRMKITFDAKLDAELEKLMAQERPQ